ncbi:MauE/DoxX family redox-associated membrane protein [Methylopila jiangsuensis]|nr:MauE/DoxX family redox-associated membrane protein [Methylopila jiangsuensis]
MAMSLIAEPLVTTFLRSFLILLFAGAALSKLRRTEEFFGVVRNFRILPERLARPVAAALPFVELATAAGLAVPAVAPYAAGTASGLLIVFGLAIGANVVRGRTAIDCGCFRDGLKQPLSWRLVGRNAVLALAAGGLAAALPLARPAAPVELAVGVAAAGLAMLLYFSASLLGGLSAGARRAPSLTSKG